MWKFLDARVDDLLVVLVVTVHGLPRHSSESWNLMRQVRRLRRKTPACAGVTMSAHITQLPRLGSAGLRVRSGRTVGPRARMRCLICAGRGPSAVASARTEGRRGGEGGCRTCKSRWSPEN